MKTKIVVDKTELSDIIKELEAKDKFSSRSALYDAVAQTEWAKNHSKPLTASVICLRINEYDISLITLKGKKGRQAGVKLSDSHKLAMQAGRKTRIISNVEEMKRSFPKTRHNLIDKVANGSIISAVKAKCIECCGYEQLGDGSVTQTIRECNIKSCALWSFRPYQPK